MRVLVACEESQTVTKAFRRVGVEAFSCDVQECSGDRPEWHIRGDAIEEAYSGKYDMMIAHPPCTFMSRAGARWMYPTAGNLCPDRYGKSQEAKAFFMKLFNAPIDLIAVENPLPLKVVGLPPHDQVIQPYQFGDPFSKRTHLWIKGLPNLTPTDVLMEYRPFLPSNTGGAARGQKHTLGVAKTQKEYSVTFQGIASAMADQWGSVLKNNLSF